MVSRAAYLLESIISGSIDQITDIRKLDHLISSLGKMAEISKGKATASQINPDGFPPQVVENLNVKTLSFKHFFLKSRCEYIKILDIITKKYDVLILREAENYFFHRVYAHDER